jgi:hypothetical protein
VFNSQAYTLKFTKFAVYRIIRDGRLEHGQGEAEKGRSEGGKKN